MTEEDCEGGTKGESERDRLLFLKGFVKGFGERDLCVFDGLIDLDGLREGGDELRDLDLDRDLPSDGG